MSEATPGLSNRRPIDHGGPVDRAFVPFPDSALRASVPARFAAIASAHASRLAVTDAQRAFTYAELSRLADSIAAGVAAAVPPGAPVGILLGHEARTPAAMLGILRAGAAYVPLDAQHPAARLAAIAANAGLAAIISAGPLVDRAATLVPGIPVIDLETLAEGARTIIPPDPAAIAWILYTSGSTGAPKGVFQDHRGLLHDVMQYVNAAHLAPQDRLTSFYSPATVGAVRDIWAALLTGASLHIQPPHHGTAAMAAFLRDAAPSIYHSVPALLRHLAAADTPPLPCVRLGYVAGDRVDRDDVGAFFRLFPNALLYTGLGATEASTIYVHRFVARDAPLPEGRVPVGHAMPDRLALLVDEAGWEVPPGEVGEIVVCSPYIARGYWRAEALTAERFSDDPARPGWRRYRTGDLGRWRADGLLEHLGRTDQMVKLGGQRVELAAVEVALKSLPGIAEAAVLVRPAAATGGQPQLVGHVVPCPTGTAHTQGALLAALRRILPPPMVPATLMVRVRLALLPNFKVDRAALAQDDAALAVADSRHADGPSAMVAAIAAEIFELPAAPGADHDLLALGADSIGIIGLAVALEQHFGRLVPLEAVVAARTPRRIAAWIEACSPSAGSAHAAIATLRAGATGAAPLLWPHDVGGGWHGVPALLPFMAPGRTWLGLRDPAGDDATRPADSLEAHAALMFAALRAAGHAERPGGIPIGWSFGGRLAWELGAQMQAAGWTVPCVVIIDAPTTPVGAGLEPGDPDAPWRAAAERRYRIAAQYHAGAAPLDLVLIRSAGGGPHLAGLPEDLGWSGLARSIRRHTIPGDHLTLWQEGGQDLCRVLETVLPEPARLAIGA